MQNDTQLRKARLRALIDARFSGSQKALADASGLTEGRITQLLNPNEAFGERAAQGLADKLNLGEYFSRQLVEGNPLKEDVLQIPQYNTGGKMGNGLVLRDQPGIIKSWSVSPEWLRLNVPNCTHPNNLAIVTGFGDSMRGMFNPGDPLLVDTGIKTVEFDAVYFFRVGDEGYIKRLQRIPTAEGTILRAKSENPAYESFSITKDMDFEVFARVLKIWQGADY